MPSQFVAADRVWWWAQNWAHSKPIQEAKNPHPVNIFVSLRGQFFGNFGTQPLNERYSDVSPLANRPDAQFTVNVPLLPVPPIVVTAIGPVMAPVGTLVVIFVAEFTVNVVALTPP